MTPKHLFDYSIERLVSKGLARYEDGDSLRDKKLPSSEFLFVPPQPPALFQSPEYLNHLVSQIEYNDLRCKNYIEPSVLSDLIETPTGPSLICNIDDGATRLKAGVADARAGIRFEGRIPYTIWQAIVHAIVFPKFLDAHGMDILGSRAETGFRPVLYLHHGLPKLDQWWTDFDSPKWGAPSYRSIIVP